MGNPLQIGLDIQS